MPEVKLPRDILAALHQMTRHAEVLGLMHAVIEDIQSSHGLALSRHLALETISEVHQEVTDYVANHYGDD